MERTLRREPFWTNITVYQQLANIGIVFDVLFGNFWFCTQAVFFDIEVCDLVGKVFDFDDDCGQKVRKRSAIWHTKPLLHLLCTLAAKQSHIAIAADTCEAELIANAFINDAREFFFRDC